MQHDRTSLPRDLVLDTGLVNVHPARSSSSSPGHGLRAGPAPRATAHTAGAPCGAHVGAARGPPHHHGATWVAIHGLTTQDFRTPGNLEAGSRTAGEPGPVRGGPVTAGPV
jgi:hypothetical protein